CPPGFLRTSSSSHRYGSGTEVPWMVSTRSSRRVSGYLRGSAYAGPRQTPPIARAIPYERWITGDLRMESARWRILRPCGVTAYADLCEDGPPRRQFGLRTEDRPARFARGPERGVEAVVALGSIEQF